MAKLLFYDIPEKVATGKKKFKNPSRRLRRIGFRLNYSNWVLPNGREPWALITEMNEAEVNNHMLEFSSASADALMALARIGLLKEIALNHARMEKSSEKTLAAFNKSESPDARKRLDKKLKKILKKTEKLLGDLANAAQGFGLSTDFLSANAALDAVMKIKLGVEARAEAYVAMTGRVAEVDPALAAAAEESNVPPGVLADRLEETGEDTEAVRELFNEPELEEATK